MPNMTADGFIDPAQVTTIVSNTPVNLDYQFQNAVGNAIANQSILGSGSAHTCTLSVSAYTASNSIDSSQKNDLINRMIQRLTNLGYTATLSGTTLTITWP